MGQNSKWDRQKNKQQDDGQNFSDKSANCYAQALS